MLCWVLSLLVQAAAADVLLETRKFVPLVMGSSASSTIGPVFALTVLRFVLRSGFRNPNLHLGNNRKLKQRKISTMFFVATLCKWEKECSIQHTKKSPDNGLVISTIKISRIIRLFERDRDCVIWCGLKRSNQRIHKCDGITEKYGNNKMCSSTINYDLNTIELLLPSASLFLHLTPAPLSAGSVPHFFL